VCLSSGEAEEGRDEAELPLDFTLADPFCLSLPDQVYCLVTGDRPPGSPKRPKALAGFDSSFDSPMILFQDVVQILHLPQSTAAPQLPFLLQLLHSRRVAPTFVDIDDARSGWLGERNAF
jgi:hypothetical protein